MFARPNGLRENGELRFRVGEVDLPERRERYTSSREEEGEVDAQMCPCGEAIESRSHVVGECEMYKEEREVLEEMREVDECEMYKEFGTLDSSGKTIAILGDNRWWPQATNQEGDKNSKKFLLSM